jgi:hypothetical protein
MSPSLQLHFIKQSTMTHLKPRTVIGISLLIGALVAFSALVGIYSPDFYLQETLNWQLQAAAQDIIDLVLVVPALVVMSLLASSSKRASLIWAGVLMYLVYTFFIYAFDVRFNSLFVFYCFILGICAYSFFYFLLSQVEHPLVHKPRSSAAYKGTGLFFMIIAFSFYVLWLMEIVPALWSGSTPASLAVVDLPTNPVHVLDLSFVLPGIMLTGILVLKKNPVALTFAPVLLTFFILMDITIAAISVTMKKNGLESSYTLAILMVVLTIFSSIMLMWFFKHAKLDEFKRAAV